MKQAVGDVIASDNRLYTPLSNSIYKSTTTCNIELSNEMVETTIKPVVILDNAIPAKIPLFAEIPLDNGMYIEVTTSTVQSDIYNYR